MKVKVLMFRLKGMYTYTWNESEDVNVWAGGDVQPGMKMKMLMILLEGMYTWNESESVNDPTGGDVHLE